MRAGTTFVSPPMLQFLHDISTIWTATLEFDAATAVIHNEI